MPYLLHTSILFTACFAFYWLLLRRETFFKLNRWVLISSILISVILPFISIPESWSFKKSTPLVEITQTDTSPANNLSASTPIPNENKGEIALAPLEETVPQPTANQPITSNFELDIKQVLNYLYFIGLGVFGLTFLVQLLLLIAKMTSLNSMKDGKYRIVELVKDEAPYSFFNAIFINPAKYDQDTFEQIIDHEKIHIRQIHFFDKMVAEIILIVFWFNPIVWLYRRAITNNLEYLTDHSMLRQGTEKKRYQLSLLQVSVPQHPLNLTTNYNQSFLKDRITMMNSKKSSARSFWKYLFILPLFGLSMMSMNNVVSEENNENTDEMATVVDTSQNNEVDQNRDSIPSESETKTTYHNHNGETHQHTEITTFSKQAEIAYYENLKEQGYAEGEGGEQWYEGESQENWEKNKVKEEDFPKVKEKDGLQISIDKNGKVSYKLKNKFRSLSFDNDMKPGNWQGEIQGDEVCFFMRNKEISRHNSWSNTACFSKSELSNIPVNEQGKFSITRAAGTLNLTGEFGNDNFGRGEFEFERNADFIKYLSGEGVNLRDDDDHIILHLFYANINRQYIKEMKAEGFEITEDFLHEVATHGVTLEYYRGLQKAGLNVESTHDLIEAKIHGISAEYAAEMAGLGFKNLNIQELKEAKIHGVSANFAADMKQAGFPNLSLEDLKHGAIHGISANYLAAFAEVGFNDLSFDDVVSAKIHGVRADYVREIRGMGFKGASLDEIKNMKIHGISESYLHSIREAGYTDVSLDDIVSLKIHGVSASTIQGMRDLGFKNLELEDIAGAKIHGVTPKYINSLREMGFKNTYLEDYVGAKIHGVSPRYIERARASGYNFQDLEDYVDIKIRGVRLK